MGDLKYESVQPVPKHELADQLVSNDPQIVVKALYSAAKYEEDWGWVQDQCLRLLISPEVKIRWAAATSLGDLAFFRCPLDLDRVVPALEAAAKDPAVADPANFSLSMVRQFLSPESVQ